MTDAWKTKIDRWIDQQRPHIEAIYAELHALAEISWQEQQTTDYVSRKLEEYGLDVRVFPEHTGAVGSWDSGQQGRNVALRADMDALWQKVNQQWRANHSCGHDAHMTIVLSAIRCLKEIGYEPTSGQLIAIFQPAEEVAEGAIKLTHSGVMDDIDYLLGIHLRPQKEMAFGQASSAICHGGVVSMNGVIRGRQSHAARPEDGINVIETFAAMVNSIGQLQAHSSQAGSCKVTKVHVPNESRNIIPDYLEFVVDIRASTNEQLTQFTEQIQQIAKESSDADGAKVEMEIASRTVPAIRDEEMEAIIGEVITEVLGAEGWTAPLVTPGGEDFHFYRTERRSLNATMIGLGSDLTPGLHAPDMSFNLDALSIGVAIMALSAIKLLE